MQCIESTVADGYEMFLLDFSRENYFRANVERLDPVSYTHLVEVLKDGPACHLGTESCFNETVYQLSLIHI